MWLKATMRRYLRRLRFSSTAVTLLVIGSERGDPRCCDRLTAQGICMPHDFNGGAETIRPTSCVLGGGCSKKHAAPVHQLQRKAAVQHVGGALKHVAGTPRKDILDLRRSWEQSQRTDRGQNSSAEAHLCKGDLARHLAPDFSTSPRKGCSIGRQL
jgi:hypothetical protein